MKKILDTKYRKQENEYKLQKICSHPFKLKLSNNTRPSHTHKSRDTQTATHSHTSTDTQTHPYTLYTQAHTLTTAPAQTDRRPHPKLQSPLATRARAVHGTACPWVDQRPPPPPPPGVVGPQEKKMEEQGTKTVNQDKWYKSSVCLIKCDGLLYRRRQLDPQVPRQ